MVRCMRPTRKLQMAAELIEEAADEMPDEYAGRAEELADEVDELRGPVHMQMAAEKIQAKR